MTQQATTDSNTGNGRLISRQELAKILSVCPHTIARMERRGLIKGIRLNSRLIRYPQSEVQRLLAQAGA